MIRITSKIERKGDAKAAVDKIMAALKGPSKVKVGLPKGKAASDVIATGVYNHEGTSRGIPPRPFLTMAMFDGRAALRAQLRGDAARIMRGETTMAAALPGLGLKGQGLIQKKIASTLSPPDAPSTIRRKGSAATLIDSGRLRGAITWDIDT